MIRNIDDCKTSNKDGEYGGASGLKEGVVIDGENWLIKYPKNANYLTRHEEMEYTNDPTSEYIGSHIYEILGYPVHETMLVERKGKICVACKDFCTDQKRLVEVRTLKNSANNDMAEELDRSFESTGLSHIVLLEEILLHIKHNRLLTSVKGITERFYDQIVIDAFINNSDRNNGNWGLLRQDGKEDTLAPIFDNGGALNGKTPDSRLKRMLDAAEGVRQTIFNGISIYGYTDALGKEKNYLTRDLLTQPLPELWDSLIKNVPLIGMRMEEIIRFVDEIEDRACSSIRKEFYIRAFESRYKELLLPAYKQALVQKEKELAT